jgi:hypothetical protein
MHSPKRLPFAFLLMGLAFARPGYAALSDLPRLGTFIDSDFCVSKQSDETLGLGNHWQDGPGDLTADRDASITQKKRSY